MVLNKFRKRELYKHKSEGAKGDGRLGPACPPKVNKGFFIRQAQCKREEADEPGLYVTLSKSWN